jgi:hypothetical protein
MVATTRTAPTAPSGKQQGESRRRSAARVSKVAAPGGARGAPGGAATRGATSGGTRLVSSPGSDGSRASTSVPVGGGTTMSSPGTGLRGAAAAAATTMVTLPGGRTHAPARLVQPETPNANSGALSVVIDDDVTSPSDKWFDCAKSGKKAEEQRKIDLQDFVRHDLFSAWKFFTDKRQLIFDTSSTAVCYHICTAMHVRPDFWSLWWEHNKDELVATLNRKRTDVTAVLKRVFIGKCG